MSVKDLDKFLQKVEQLNSLIKMISESPEKRITLSNCNNHDEVVKLASEWGFEIGKRWGEY